MKAREKEQTRKRKKKERKAPNKRERIESKRDGGIKQQLESFEERAERGIWKVGFQHVLEALHRRQRRKDFSGMFGTGVFKDSPNISQR